MTGSAFDALGSALQDFLTAQYGSPAGASTTLAFFPGGIAVSPETFSVGGVVNPMLVDAWLDTVTDHVAPVTAGQTAPSLLRASELMADVALFAQPTAVIGTEAAQTIGKLKGAAAAAAAPGEKVVATAPADWFDPARVPGWAVYDSGTVTPADPHDDPAAPAVWRWRVLDPLPSAAGGMLDGDTVALPSPPGPGPAAAVGVPIPDPALVEVSSSAVVAGAGRLRASYQLVALDRSQWWSAALIRAGGWFVAGQPAGSLVPGPAGAGASVGVPVAMVVTADVTITASWSDSDQAAAARSTHLGPWALPSDTPMSAAGSGTATISIPAMQAIGCVYELLPTLPPDDPPRRHVVKAGDTFAALAHRFGTTIAALLAANPQVTNPGLIHPGDVLTIP